MKSVDIRLKSDDELRSDLSNLKKRRMGLRFEKASKALSNTSLMKKNQKDIARIFTVMSERQINR